MLQPFVYDLCILFTGKQPTKQKKKTEIPLKILYTHPPCFFFWNNPITLLIHQLTFL